MPRINPIFFDCVFYMYPSVEAAENSQKAGGSGFIVSVPSKTTPNLVHLYAVTNKHVVDGDPYKGIPPSRVIRMNTRDGKFAIADSASDRWERHIIDDIAVTNLSIIGNAVKYSHIPIDQFVTEHKVNKYGIGPGDNVFMIGRFAYHEGKRQNVPSVRFGNISIMHDEVMAHPSGKDVESFAVEMRSIGGYSGSPVFVYFNTFDPRPNIEGVEPPVRSTYSVHGLQVENIGPLLLGIDWGHIPLNDSLIDPETGKLKHYIKSNSNMAGVAPAGSYTE